MAETSDTRLLTSTLAVLEGMGAVAHRPTDGFVLVSLFTVMLVGELNVHLLSPLLPAVASDFSVSVGTAGTLVTGYSLGRRGRAFGIITAATELDLILGGVRVPKGRHTLYTLPSETKWQLIVNKQTGQWGTEYDASQDLARIDLHKETLPQSVEQFTISFDRRGDDAAVMKLAWENALLSVPLRDAASPDPANPPQVPPFSPPAVAELTLEGKQVRIDYARPFRRGRKIMGGVVPYGQVWRTGANDPTALTTEADLEVGGAQIPKGSYTLYTLSSEQTWKLIISRKKRMGAAPGMPHEMQAYDPSQDLVRIDLKKQAIPDAVEQLTIWFEPIGRDTVVLKLAWENTLLSIPFKAK